MAEPARTHFTQEQFHAWVAGQDARYELVNGEPVMMAGANRRHDRIAGNAFRLIANHLLGHRCQPFTSDTYVTIPAGNLRQPDLGIDCGPFRDTALDAAEPVLVIEILSPTTRIFDRNDKLEEYKTVGCLNYILLIDPDHPQVRLYERDPERAWTSERIAGLDAVLTIPLFDLRIRLADLYATLEFRPRPTLVEPGNGVAGASI